MGSGGGEAKTLPTAQPSARPLPTKPRKVGSCPEPPPTTMPTLPGRGPSTATTERGLPSTRRKCREWAARTPSSISSTALLPSLMIFLVCTAVLPNAYGGILPGGTRISSSRGKGFLCSLAGLSASLVQPVARHAPGEKRVRRMPDEGMERDRRRRAERNGQAHWIGPRRPVRHHRAHRRRHGD